MTIRDDIWQDRKARLKPIGKPGSPGILTQEQRDDVLARVRAGHTQVAIHKTTGVSPKKISEISGKKGANGLTYESWQAMVTRCTNPESKDFKYYGGAGVTVCERWLHSYGAFLEDMGERPGKKLTLDRKDGSKGYSKENCRWATRTKQSRNRAFATLDDERAAMVRCLIESGFDRQATADAFGISSSVVNSVASGRSWRPEAA